MCLFPSLGPLQQPSSSRKVSPSGFSAVTFEAGARVVLFPSSPPVRFTDAPASKVTNLSAHARLISLMTFQSFHHMLPITTPFRFHSFGSVDGSPPKLSKPPTFTRVP